MERAEFANATNECSAMKTSPKQVANTGRMNFRGRGFTLIELIMVLAIASILFGLAIPQLSQFAQNARLTSSRNAVFTMLQLGRAQAIFKRTRVIVCPSGDGQHCSGGWDSGALVFHDGNNNRQHEPNETIFSVMDPQNLHGVRIQGNRRLVAFTPDGRSEGTNLSISFCLPGKPQGHSVVVSNAGRVRTGKIACS